VTVAWELSGVLLGAVTARQSCYPPSSGPSSSFCASHYCTSLCLSWHQCHFLEQSPSRQQSRRLLKARTPNAMEYFSLKRSGAAERGQGNLSSKVYVRSTKSGKVQKIVRELYLRQDIPCSSNLCRACLDIAPTDYSKKGGVPGCRLRHVPIDST
jgi:hypothetical protein